MTISKRDDNSVMNNIVSDWMHTVVEMNLVWLLFLGWQLSFNALALIEDVSLAQRVPETPTLQSFNTIVPRTENLHLEFSC